MNSIPVKLIQTRHGPMKAFTQDAYVTPCLEVFGEYSRAEWELLAQLVRAGDTVVEAGAYIGAHTVPLAKACNPGPLYVFEPHPDVFCLLQENIKLNGITNARLIQQACGAAPGQAFMPAFDFSSPDNFGGYSVRPEEGGSAVDVTTLDALNLL